MTNIYLIMGVSGSGKTTVGKLLAKESGLPFYDADDYHPAANIQKMASGQPLNDADRQPWLEILAAQLQVWQQTNGAVLACSALKEKYRRTLVETLNFNVSTSPDFNVSTSPDSNVSTSPDSNVSTSPDFNVSTPNFNFSTPPEKSTTPQWVWLDGSFDLIQNRIQQRHGHFMDADMLQSQFDALEPPNYGIKINIDQPPTAIVQKILEHGS